MRSTSRLLDPRKDARAASAPRSNVRLRMGIAAGRAQQPARARRTNLETRTLNARIPYHGVYAMRGRCVLCRVHQAPQRGLAVRNTRAGASFNPLVLRLVLAEAERLVGAGESLWDVLEAFAELLTSP